MKELFLINDRLANKISYYHLMLLLASLPFDMFYSHLILISFGVHTLIQLHRAKFKAAFNWRLLLLSSVFGVTVVSTFYSADKTQAFNEWGKHITIVLVPLLFSLSPFDFKKYKNRLLLAFSLVCTATVLYLYGNAVYTIRFYHLPIRSLFSGHFTNHNFADPIAMHATFFSMQLGIALVFILATLLKKTSSAGNVLLCIFCALVLSAALMQLGSKSVIGCLFIVINIGLPLFMLPKNSRIKFVLISACFWLLPVGLVLRSDGFRERYVIAMMTDLSAKRTDDESVEPRLVRWQAISDLIIRSPIVGYGAGTETGLLQDLFYNKKFYRAYLNKLNAHSEYLSMLLKAGIVGLLVYAFTLAFGLKTALKNNDLLFFSFILLIVFVSLSENLLDVDKGIIFYAFFFSMFYFSADGSQANHHILLPNAATNGRLITSL